MALLLLMLNTKDEIEMLENFRKNVDKRNENAIMTNRERSINEVAKYYFERFCQNVTNFVKWLFLALSVGCIVGGISSLFSYTLAAVTSCREIHNWLFYLLPVSGLIIVFLYDKFGKDDGGTNQVLSTVCSKDEVPFRSAPLIFAATALTHLTGGSAGREGAAIQLGGSIANQMGRLMHLDAKARRMIVMCGMSAAFAALFGTPMAAAIFSLEVASVGSMCYTALMPCMISALIASRFAASMGVHPEVFQVTEIPELTVELGSKMGILALACSAISVAFCITLKVTGKFYRKWMDNKYIRVLVASGLIIGITTLLQTTDYMGAGAELIEKAIEQGEVEPLAFFWKLLLTALTMKAGFKGGEIVPSFCIGATFGCVLGQLLGIPYSISAAAGMIAVFCGVTNCPIASMLIAFELFGFEGVSYYVIAVAISYATSGYYTLYKTQTIIYSKYKTKSVNQKVSV